MARREDRRLSLAGPPGAVRNIDVDRVIFDRRPANSCEYRLRWARLPLGTQLSRVSGEDSKSYFFQLENVPYSRPYDASGRQFKGEENPELQLEAGRAKRLTLRVCAMGGLNSADVAQATHEAVLQQA